MNKRKKIFIITITFLMLIGLTTLAATDIDNNDTTTITETSHTNIIDTTTQTNVKNYDTINTNEASPSQTDSIQETTNSQETLNDKNREKTQNLKTSRDVIVNNYTDLKNYLTNNTYDTVTVYIGDNILLAGNIIVNNAIKNLTINGNGKTIDGNNQYSFLNIRHALNVDINSLTITQCNSTSYGGAIYANTNSNMTVTDSSFTNNNANNGGAIYFFGNLTITQSNLTNNNAEWNGAALVNHGNLIIRKSTINNNNADRGAIYSTGNTSITYSTINNNNANRDDAGAITIDGNLTIIESILNNNKGVVSGAIRSNGGIITIIGSTLNYNNASRGGGAIGNSGCVYVYNSTFVNNTIGGNGGAIACYNLTSINSTFINNTARDYGGAISLHNGSIIDSKFYNNTATVGGAIYGFNPFHDNIGFDIINCEFENNTGRGSAINSDTNVSILNSTFNNHNGEYLCIFHNATISNSNFTNNSVTAELILSHTEMNILNSRFLNNYNINKNSYIIRPNNYHKSMIIKDSIFINNTDNLRDMLFGNTNEDTTVNIQGNTYIDNYLLTTIKINKPITIISDNEARTYDYDIELNLREIYNDTVRNGTLNVYVNGVLKDTTNVTSGHARILFGNSDLTKRENNITLEYITLSKHYQNSSTSLILYKEVNTTLSIQAPSTMTAGDVAVINFTLKDVNNNPLSGETIHVLVDEEQVATVTTDSNGIATYIFNAFGNDTVNIEATHHTSNDSFYLSAQDAVAKIKVNMIEPKIFISNDTIVPNVETNITINLFDDDGNPIKNKTLNVNITEEGKPDITGTVTTDENGIAIFTFTPTDEGTLNVTVTSPGDLIYHEASESVQISKNFIITNMFVNASSMKINETNTIIIEVFPADGKLISGTVELDIDGENHTVNITNGRGTYPDYKSATAGEKNVTAKFTSSIPGYANVTTKEKFNVEKLPTRVTIEAINRTAGNVTLKVLVFPEDYISSIVDGGNVVIESVNGENRIVIYNNTLENGELIYLTDINQTGWYEFETTYHGNDYFLGEENNTGSLQVLLVNTTTITFNKTARVGDTITLNATVTDVDGNPVNDGNITFLVDRTLLEAKLENGMATTEYTLPVTYTKGNYTIKANYLGTNKYNTSSGEAKLSIDLQETRMNVKILNDTKGNTTIEVTLNSTPDNKPISGADIIITDKNGNPIGEGTTDNNGVANITITVPVGDNEITISYLGDDIHSPQEETKTVNVTPRESETTGTIINNTVGNVTIDVQVVDPVTGEPVTGPVNITLNGEVVGNSTLDDEGRTTIPANITGKGNYTLVVEYSGNDDYNGSTDTLEDVYIKGKDVAVDVIIDNPVVGETEVIITIVDPETGKPIPNAPVVITLPNGTNVTGKTDDKGTATIPVDLPSGDNNITISYTGDKTHEDKEIKNTIRVKSYSVVTVNPVTGVVLDNVTFTANVVDYQDKPVTGGYIQFSVGGRTLKDENGKNIRILVENGVAKLSYKAESGWIIDTHPDLTVQAVYTGTSIVLANRSETNKVSIYKRNATVTVSAPDDYVNGTLHIDAIVKDQNGSLINDGNLVFKLNGLSLKDENNKGIVAQVKNGKVQLSAKLPFAYSAKKYNLTAVYSNKIYNKATGMNTTTLKAIPTYITAIAVVSDQFSKPVVTGQIYNKNNNAILQGTAVLNIKFDGISYAKKVVVNNGTFSETLEGISIYKPGTHKVEIAVGANSHYEAVRETYTPKATAKYDATPVITNITRNKTTTRVQAKILDTHNRNAQKDLKITIKVNGLSFLVNQTVKNGKVDVLVDTSTLKNRTYNLELVSGANTYYNAGKATTELPKY